MYIYYWWQWLLFFFFYSFIGWIWESSYVSVKTKRFVNRGFLHLPLLPLYGSGALVVLLVGLPLRDQPLLLYFTGLAAATFLEMVTGLSMEAIYKVKYWDYSTKKINYKGVICLEASVLWGVFSLLMVEVVQTPVEHLLMSLPEHIIWGTDAVIGVCFVYDFYVSNREAIRLARVLTAMEKAREEMRTNLRRMEEELAEQKRILEDNLANAKAHAQQELEDRILEALVQTEEMYERTTNARRRLVDSATLLMAESRYKVERARDKVEDASLELMIQADDLKARGEAVYESIGSAASANKRKAEHMIEGARLNILFGNQEILERINTQRQEYLALQKANLEKAKLLSREMMLRNPSARTLIGREVNFLLRGHAAEWLEEKRKKKEEAS